MVNIYKTNLKLLEALSLLGRVLPTARPGPATLREIDDTFERSNEILLENGSSVVFKKNEAGGWNAVDLSATPPPAPVEKRIRKPKETASESREAGWARVFLRRAPSGSPSRAT